MSVEVIVPDLGDIDSVEVIEVWVQAGEKVSANDVLVVVESDKASMEIPFGISGTVDEILVSVGDQVAAGQTIARVAAT